MTEEELSQLRSRLGVNTFGTFVDRFVLVLVGLDAAPIAPSLLMHGTFIGQPLNAGPLLEIALPLDLSVPCAVSGRWSALVCLLKCQNAKIPEQLCFCTTLSLGALLLWQVLRHVPQGGGSTCTPSEALCQGPVCQCPWRC